MQAQTYSLWMHFEEEMLRALHHCAKGFNSIAEKDFYDFVLHNMKLQALYALTKEPILLARPSTKHSDNISLHTYYVLWSLSLNVTWANQL